MKTACLIYGRDLHYLDHLAPLAGLLDIPLVMSEDDIFDLVPKFYPNVKPLYFDPIEIHSALIHEFDAVIYSFTAKHFHSFFSFAQDLHKKKIKTLWCPHGNSDKDNLGALQEEPRLLIYGKKMEELLRQKNVTRPFFNVGNFRLDYYQRNRKFYDSLMNEVLAPFAIVNPIYLYAPTWQDYENGSSFFDRIEDLLKELPSSVNLIVKLHPNTWQKEEFTIDRIFYPYEQMKNLLLLREPIPIYPLLERTVVYIGDTSSIGYDFLAFNRPMFFLTEKKTPLSSCGQYIPKGADVYATIQKTNDAPFAELRKNLYDYTFAKTRLCPQSLQQFPV